MEVFYNFDGKNFITKFNQKIACFKLRWVEFVVPNILIIV